MMSLQKPPTTTANSSGNLVPTRRQLLANRRRTLQTVTELTSEDQTSENIPPLPIQNSDPSGQNGAGHSITKTARRDRRRSLPQQGVKFDQGSQRQPSDVTTPFDWGRRDPQSFNGQAESSGTKKSNRPSVSFAQHNDLPPLRHSSIPKGRRHSLPRNGPSPRPEQDQRQNDQSASIGKGKQSVRSHDVNGKSTPHGEGWNAWREIERRRREQEVMEAKIRRVKGGHGLVIGSSGTLPSLSPLPLSVAKPSNAKSNEIYIRGRANPQQLLRNSQSSQSHRQMNRKPNHAVANGHVGNDPIKAQLLKSASTNISPNLAAFNNSFQSTTANTGMIGLSATQKLQIQASPLPPDARFLTRSHSFSSPMSPNLAAFPQPPSAPSMQDRPSRRSSIQSTASTHTSVSNGTRSRRSSSGLYPHTRSRRPQTGITKEHLDALAALTSSPPLQPDGEMTPDTLAFLETRQTRLGEDIRSASAASDRATREALIQENQRTCSRAESRASSARSTTIYGEDGVGRNSTSGLTNESIRLLREREKLLRWKAEREKMEFERKERAKIAARVRRANELEEERSKALEKEMKKKRGCCGFLGL